MDDKLLKVLLPDIIETFAVLKRTVLVSAVKDPPLLFQSSPNVSIPLPPKRVPPLNIRS